MGNKQHLTSLFHGLSLGNDKYLGLKPEGALLVVYAFRAR